MKIIVKTNEKLDRKMFHEFFEAGMTNFITRFYPTIHNESDIDLIVKKAYEDETVEDFNKFLDDKIPIILNFANIIAEKLQNTWSEDTEITIIPSACPVAPRWINTKVFMVPIIFAKNEVLRICAHEMTHFLYFDALRKDIPNIETESLSADWLLSEIVAPFITNSHEIQEVVHSPEKIFKPDNIKLTDSQIKSIHGIWNTRKNLLDFREKSLLVLKNKTKPTFKGHS